MDRHNVKATGLPLTYRRAEVSAVADCLRAGDSCSIVGASGMAKSNLFRHLLDPEARRHYLGDDWPTYLFVALDANELGEMSERAVCTILLERLLDEAGRRGAGDEVASRLGRLQEEALSPPETLPFRRPLAQAVEAVTASHGGRLVFLFDQFDGIYRELNPRFFATLRSIRDRHKYRISYVVFTRDDLSRLGRSQENEEFEELFSAHVIGLGPYAKDDATLLLNRVGSRYGRLVPPETCERLIALTGGHPGLLKATYMALLNKEAERPEAQEQTAESFLKVRDVQSECVKLWRSLSSAEQDFLHGLVVSKAAPRRNIGTERLLRMKGIIPKGDDVNVSFSPIFSKYISVRSLTRVPSTKIRAGSIRIDTAGEVWVDEKQVTPPLSKKELLLLEYLCLEPGSLRTKDEIIAVVYPDEYRSGEGVSDDALNALIKRLRDHLGRFHERDRIVTVRGKGYRLDA